MNSRGKPDVISPQQNTLSLADEYDDDISGSTAGLSGSSVGHSGENTIRWRNRRACDQCRKSKLKCEQSAPDEPCRGCVMLRTACTSLGPSRKRGPPKGYIDAIEARLLKTEALLGSLFSTPDDSPTKAYSLCILGQPVSHTGHKSEEKEPPDDEMPEENSSAFRRHGPDGDRESGSVLTASGGENQQPVAVSDWKDDPPDRLSRILHKLRKLGSGWASFSRQPSKTAGLEDSNGTVINIYNTVNSYNNTSHVDSSHDNMYNTNSGSGSLNNNSGPGMVYSMAQNHGHGHMHIQNLNTMGYVLSWLPSYIWNGWMWILQWLPCYWPW